VRFVPREKILSRTILGHGFFLAGLFWTNCTIYRAEPAYRVFLETRKGRAVTRVETGKGRPTSQNPDRGLFWAISLVGHLPRKPVLCRGTTRPIKSHGGIPQVETSGRGLRFRAQNCLFAYFGTCGRSTSRSTCKIVEVKHVPRFRIGTHSRRSSEKPHRPFSHPSYESSHFYRTGLNRASGFPIGRLFRCIPSSSFLPASAIRLTACSLLPSWIPRIGSSPAYHAPDS
jgi:hypothetical protein